MRIIAIVNQKGGCGKTTTAINLAAAAARRGRRVLLVDLDPQSHCALGLAIPESRIERHIGDALVADLSVPYDFDNIVWQVSSNLDLAPSTMRLAGLEAPGHGLHRLADRDQRLRQLLHGCRHRYDLCFVDCPPHIGLLTFNAVRAATEVIIPVETSYFALQSAQRQVRTVQTIGRRLGRDVPFHLLPTLFDNRVVLSREILTALRESFGEAVLPLEIAYSTDLREAASFGQAIIEYAPRSQARHDYDALLDWLEAHPTPPVEPEPMTALPPPQSSPHDAPSPNQQSQLAAAIVETRPWPPQSTTSRTRVGGDRAAELARRAGELAERNRRLHQKPAAASSASLGPREIRHDPTCNNIASPPEPDHPGTHDYGPRQSGNGVLFAHPGLSRDQHVSIVGDFNDWVPQATPMRFDRDREVFHAFLELPAGRYRYRFVVDGRWIIDPSNSDKEIDDLGREASVVVVPAASPSANDIVASV